MNSMQRRLSVMRSVVKCLASSILLLLAFTALAQEPEYIDYDDYYWGCGKTIKEAIEDLKVNVNDVVTVATKTKLENVNGDFDYSSTTGTEAFYKFQQSGITLIPMEGYWRAGIKKSEVEHVEGVWVEQNITVNNTYNAAPTHSRGFQRNQSTRVTTRQKNVMGPSGRTVSSTPGTTTETRTKSAWNGRYGWSKKTVRNRD